MCPPAGPRGGCGDRGGLLKVRGVRGPAEAGPGKSKCGRGLACVLSDLRQLVALIKVTFIGCEMFSFVR